MATKNLASPCSLYLADLQSSPSPACRNSHSAGNLVAGTGVQSTPAPELLQRKEGYILLFQQIALMCADKMLGL